MNDYEKLINKKCKIIPFENLDGIITGIYISKKGIEYQIRYYMNCEQKIEYFFDFEIEVLNAD